MNNQLSDVNLLKLTKDLVVRQGLLSVQEADSLIGVDKVSCKKIASDGSTRRFWRILENDTPLCVVAAPEGCSVQELAEARAAWMIGSHLKKQQVAVPKIYGWDEEAGILLFEDLGDLRLHDLFSSTNDYSSASAKEKIFAQVIENLAFMQCKGVEGFDSRWCWDTPIYDLSLMIERESKYFLDAFWEGLLGENNRPAVFEELQEIALNGAKSSAEFFLHRDFQSRNIMVKSGKSFFIDFQGARLGPLGYDLASLLIDPYTQLTEDIQANLIDHYLECLGAYKRVERESFLCDYNFLAMQRNLQIIGAFAFLYKVRGKMFFKQFLLPALIMLRKRLDLKYFTTYKNLRILVDDSLRLLKK